MYFSVLNDSFRLSLPKSARLTTPHTVCRGPGSVCVRERRNVCVRERVNVCVFEEVLPPCQYSHSLHFPVVLKVSFNNASEQTHLLEVQVREESFIKAKYNRTLTSAFAFFLNISPSSLC